MSAQEARGRALLFAASFASVAAASTAWLAGFTVDDALIVARIATNLAAGFGHRFNIDGPVVDAVTPFGWAYLLAPAARAGPIAALHFAKWLGAVSWVLAAGWLGARVSRGKGAAQWSLVLPLGACAPLSAWASSGMETGVVLALGTIALADSRSAQLASGLAAALRPELVPWSAALALGRSAAARSSKRDTALRLLTAIVPALLVAAARAVWFGTPVPLAVWAKPSDLEHGVFYALGALLWTGIPLLVLAPVSLRKISGDDRAILAAVGVHTVALVLVGGDWMPLFRLFTPVLPGLLWVGSRVCDVASPWSTAARVVLATSVSGYLFADKIGALRGVMQQRITLMERARPVLAGAKRVAALDVGWVGVATSAPVVDLAGVTDPEIARLRGGHTSKHLPDHLLERRHVDSLVLLFEGPLGTPWVDSTWGRQVEATISKEAARLGFTVEAVLEVPGTPWRYVVLGLKNRS